MARFWSGNFGAQWNQVARDVAIDRQLGIGDTARLLALANLAAADAGIAVWDSKVHYNFWRPITAIHNGADDGNDKTAGDAQLGAVHRAARICPARLPQTPPYPDYVSGANGLTGAFTTMLQLFFQTDIVPFEINKAVPGRASRSARTRGSIAGSPMRPRRSSMRAFCSASTSGSPTPWRGRSARALRGTRSRTRCGRKRPVGTTSARTQAID